MRTKTLVISSFVALVIAHAGAASADSVKLRNGQAVTGSFMSADTKVVRVLLANGKIGEFPVDQVSSVEFSVRKTEPPPPPSPAKAPTPITLPKGTALTGVLTQGIDVDGTAAGQTFKAVLDDPVMMDGKVIVPRGAAMVVQLAKVEPAGKMKGSDKIALKANSISFGGRKYDIVTTQVEQKGSGEGKKTARKVGGGAGLGAIVGGIAGGGTGAAIGAAAGAATGAIVASQGTEHLQLPAETRLQFTLDSAVTVQLWSAGLRASRPLGRPWPPAPSFSGSRSRWCSSRRRRPERSPSRQNPRRSQRPTCCATTATRRGRCSSVSARRFTVPIATSPRPR